MKEVLKMGNEIVKGHLKFEVIDKNTGKVVQTEEANNTIFSKINKLIHCGAVTTSLASIYNATTLPPIFSALTSFLLLYNIENGEDVGVDNINLPKKLVAYCTTKASVNANNGYGGVIAEASQPFITVDENNLVTSSIIYEVGTNAMNNEPVNGLYLYSYPNDIYGIFKDERRNFYASAPLRMLASEILVSTKNTILTLKTSDYKSIHLKATGKTYSILGYVNNLEKNCFMVVNKNGDIIYDSFSDGTSITHVSPTQRYMLLQDTSTATLYFIDIGTGSVVKSNYASISSSSNRVINYPCITKEKLGYRYDGANLYKADFNAQAIADTLIDQTAIKTKLFSTMSETLKALVSTIYLYSVSYDGKRERVILTWSFTLNPGILSPFLVNYIYSELDGTYAGHGIPYVGFISTRPVNYNLYLEGVIEDAVEYTRVTVKTAPSLGGPTSFVKLTNPISKTNEQILRITYTIKGSVDASFLEEEIDY